MSTLKVTRKRVTLSEKLAELDDRIAQSEGRTEKLRNERANLVKAALEQAEEIKRQVGGLTR